MSWLAQTPSFSYAAVDDEPHALVSADIWYLSEPSRLAIFRKITEAIRSAPLDDLPGQVLISGKPEWVADLSAPSNVTRAKVISDLGVRAGFAFPVLVGAEVAAVLEFFSEEVYGPLTERQRMSLHSIEASGRHLLALISDILDLAKIESGKIDLSLTSVVCQELIAEVAASLRPLAEQKGLELSVAYPPEPIVLLSDQRARSQILLNLANNAIKFTDQGQVRIELAREVLSAWSQVIIRISDTGIGIKTEDQAKLFQEFGCPSLSCGEVARAGGLRDDSPRLQPPGRPPWA